MVEAKHARDSLSSTELVVFDLAPAEVFLKSL